MNNVMPVVLFLLLLMTPAGANEKFLPPQGQTLLFIGQDEKTIEEYIRATGHQPAGFMVYTSIQDTKGLSEPVDHGAGIAHAQRLIEQYPDCALQIGLYMVGALDEIVAGKYDENIRAIGEWIKSSKRKVYLRIGYEFDHMGNHYDPAQYQRAFRYIVDHLRAQGVDNAAYVWHSSGYLNPDQPTMDWYPGDEYVDFFAVSFFRAFNAGNMNFILRRAQEHRKPFMIAEATPFGIGTLEGEGSWRRWFKPFFQFIEDQQIPVVCYINADWESLPMFRGQGWGDARVQANAWIKDHWLQMINSDRYIRSFP